MGSMPWALSGCPALSIQITELQKSTPVIPLHAQATALPLLIGPIEASGGALYGTCADLLQAMLLDPALQICLKGLSNRREQPRENLARELLELFSLGLGPYRQNDGDDTLKLAPRRHDDGARTIPRPDSDLRRRFPVGVAQPAVSGASESIRCRPAPGCRRGRPVGDGHHVEPGRRRSRGLPDRGADHGAGHLRQGSFDTCPPLDHLLAPGGQGTRSEVNNPVGGGRHRHDPALHRRYGSRTDRTPAYLSDPAPSV